MSHPILFSTATPTIPNSISWSSLRRGVPVVLLVLGLLALSPTVRAVNPPPDGGYPNGNTAEGDAALFNCTTCFDSVAVGLSALYLNTTGSSNTAIGETALFSNTTADRNTAVGAEALNKNTTGSRNTAVGAFALFGNTNGTDNTALGFNALGLNGFDAIDNTAIGSGALSASSSGSFNTAIGFNALLKNTASNNTAVGDQALLNNTKGTGNMATGVAVLFKNTTGNNNTAEGSEALFSNTTGSNNTANGLLALENNTIGHDNIAVGFEALANSKSGSSNIALGSGAGINLTTGSNNIDIGAAGLAGEANKIRIGKVGTQNGTFIAGIHGVTVANTLQVVVDVNGHLGTVGSSEQFKEAIKPMDKASEAILSLQPVTFRYKHDLDPDGVPQFGLVAEQVEKVNPDLVARDEQGKVYTVRYEAVNAMLLNEFLKEHQKVEEQQATITRLESKVAKHELTATQQRKQIEALAAGLQKVCAAVELNKAAPTQVALDDIRPMEGR